MPFFGDTLGAYMLPRVVLELLQQPGGQQQCGVCADSGFAWLLSAKQLYVWRYREGKEARLRVLTLPRQHSPAAPCAVTLIADITSSSSSSSSATNTNSKTAASTFGALAAPPTPSITPSGPAAADGSLTVAVCDADGRLTVWLDAHHLAAPVEHQLLTPGAGGAGGGLRPPLVAAFAAARLDLGSGPAFLAALSAADGSLHLVQVGAQGIFAKQLVAAPPPVAEGGRGGGGGGLVGALGSALSRALSDAFEPSSRYLRKAPVARPAVALHLAAAAGGGGQHYRLLVLTRDCLDCWAISVGLRPSQSLQWSFANSLVRQHDSRGGRGAEGGPANLDMAVGVGGGQTGAGGGQLVAVWMAEPGFASRGAAGGEAGEVKQHVVQLLELLPEGGPAVCHGVHDLVRGYEEPPENNGLGGPLRRLLYSSHSHTCLLARWQQPQPQNQGPNQPLAGAAAHYHPYSDTGASSRVCRALWTWEAATGAARSLSDDPDTAAVDIAAGDDGGGAAARWVVLSATYGVMEIAAVAAPPPQAAAAAAPPPLPGAAGGLDPAAVIANLLDAVLSQAAAITAAGGNLQPLVSGLGRRLGALGALGSPMGQSTIAHYSTQLLDLLPKQWAGGGTAAAAVAMSGGGGGGGGVPLTVAEQLSDKEFRQSLLLQCLALSGVLHALRPDVLRVLIENSEKLAVVGALHRLQAHQRDTHLAEGAGTGGGGGGGAAAAAALLSRLVAEAGQESSAREYEVLSPSEIFYARPSASVAHFLGALGRTAEAVGAQAARGLGNPGDSALSSLRAAVRELGSLIAVVVSAAVGRRDQLAGCHQLAAQEVAARLGRPDWLAGESTREALDKLARAVQVVRPAPPSPPSLELSHTLYGVTDVLLTCFSSALSAVSSPSASSAPNGGGPAPSPSPASSASARCALVGAYREVRCRLGWELLADARAEMEAAGFGGAGGGGRGGPLPPDLLMGQLEGLFRAHHCYPQLFEVCEALAAADPSLAPRLYTHMATMPPEEQQPDLTTATAPTMARYVYERLLADGRPADLLALPHQFHAGVTAFLQSLQPSASDLLAVQLSRNGQLGDAAAVLLMSATTDNKNSATAGGGKAAANAQQQHQQHEGVGGGGGGGGGLGPPRRLLALARLAARAAGATDLEAAAARQLKLLGLQARLGLSVEGAPLEPAVVLDEALAAATATARSETTAAAAEDRSETAAAAKEAAVVAIELMALMTAADRRDHASKWQLAWKAVYDADPWDEIAAARGAAAEGGGEAQWGETLGGTAVCRAAAACARSETLGFGANVVDSAPLDQVARWLRTWATSPGPQQQQQQQQQGGRANGEGGNGGSGGSQVDIRVAQCEAAVMAALRLGVEGRGGQGPAAAGAAGADGPLDMVVD
ncbi:hypothetical protein PLESTB_001476500 [Pleodorina starrii]|uniref:Nucleoporin Nup133/Nup155-like N-terminal domain-containing protein n=1 Tax=Pleodorina starrii TaxID=330485 RepID=A0A9W6BWV5_9CHLO|nr:hypothetical protein PLESTM_000647900 [Pleodorina starrii]GLC59345.1 hypothetical protein PLESTB_001476500 [Pleodorina starrii]GLC74456.1 hypothetical protein PLESTF_001514800 [Pleodorina starrii]